MFNLLTHLRQKNITAKVSAQPLAGRKRFAACAAKNVAKSQAAHVGCYC